MALLAAERTEPEPEAFAALRIAGLDIAITADADHGPVHPLKAAYDRFVAPALGDATADKLVVHARRGTLPRLEASGWTLLFDSGRLWRAYRSGRRLAFVLRTDPPRCQPWRVALFDPRDNAWQVVTAPRVPFATPATSLPHPLSFPVAELILLDQLTRRGGLLLHACGVVDRDRGLLFCGRSGAGKSTMAGMWPVSHVLNDDRVIVRANGAAGDPRGFSIFGTPWHGDHQHVSPGSAPLEAIFFLQQARDNEAVRLSPEDARRRLLTTCWLPLWDPIGTRNMFGQIVDIARRTPCYLLRFRREPSVIDEIRRAL